MTTEPYLWKCRLCGEPYEPDLESTEEPQLCPDCENALDTSWGPDDEGDRLCDEARDGGYT